MRGFKFNFITVLAFILLILYAYFAAMGVLYRKTLDDSMVDSITIAGLFFIGVVVAISACIYCMCMARASRWKNIGVPAQALLGIAIVVIFIWIGKPFSSYVTVLSNKQKIYENVSEVIGAAKTLDDAYDEYSHTRINNYSPHENSNAKNILKKSILAQMLRPEKLTSIQSQREQWLNNVQGMKISNVKMPTNLAEIKECVELWKADYQTKSAVVFSDESNVSSFEYDFDTTYSGLTQQFTGYSYWALFVAILCSIFMLIPYFTTDTFIGSKVEGGGFARIFKPSNKEPQTEDFI